MSIQQKNVSVNLAAFQSAKFLGGLSGLSNQATVVLFRLMVLNESINPKHDIAKELIKADMVAPFGRLRTWVASHMGQAISELLDNAGCDLLPQAQPTCIKSLGHRLIRGASKPSKQVRMADRIMSRTAFCVDRKVLALALCDYTLNREDKLVAAVLNNEHLIPDEFYFPVSYDYRGRMYYRGGIITPQGSDFLKGVLQFADKQEIGEFGRFAIIQALADAAGFKGTKIEAMLWARTVDLIELAKGSEGFQAAGLANELIMLNQWRAEGNNDAWFKSGIICHQDATCSGLQIAAAITGHRPTAEATNCTANSAVDGKQDVYQEVCDIIGNTDTELAVYCELYGRKLLKFAVMTLGYGAGKETLKRTVTDYLDGQGVTWQFDEQSEMVFMSALEAKCSATMSLKDQMQLFVKNTNQSFDWVTHDGFHVIHDKQAGDEVNIGAFRMEFDKSWDADDNTTAIAPNFVHSLDAAQMREAVRELDCPVACIHDSLGTRPSDYVRAATAVRAAFVAIDAKEITKQFLAKAGINLLVLGDYEATEAKDSSYFWC